jgi:RHS repeat-associated protein
MVMPNRNESASDYRYGFNGMEKDDEVKGGGNSYTTEFRQYDPRIARWTSLDPLMAKFPHQSPYVAFDNNPIVNNDPKGSAAEGQTGGKDKIGRLSNKRSQAELDGKKKKVKRINKRLDKLLEVTEGHFDENPGETPINSQANSGKFG